MELLLAEVADRCIVIVQSAAVCVEYDEDRTGWDG